jgi:hypothetical protein
MKTSLAIILSVTFALIAMRAAAQQATALSPPPSQTPSPTQAVAPSPVPQMPGMQMMGDMESMKRMADMCQEMMNKEKAAMPFIIGALVAFGVLLFVALVLFVILEVLWIRHWSRALKHDPRV